MCADMFKGMPLKNKAVKRSQKQNITKKTRKERSKALTEKKFKEITELIFVDTSQPIITECKC